MIITTKDTEQRGGQARVTHERLLLIARHRRLAEEYRALLMTRKPARRDRLPGFALMAVEAGDAAATKRLRKSGIEIGRKVRVATLRCGNHPFSGNPVGIAVLEARKQSNDIGLTLLQRSRGRR
jgi:hypothetical protein